MMPGFVSMARVFAACLSGILPGNLRLVYLHALQAGFHYDVPQPGVVNEAGFEVFYKQVYSKLSCFAAKAALEIIRRFVERIGQDDSAFECVTEALSRTRAYETAGLTD